MCGASYTLGLYGPTAAHPITYAYLGCAIDYAAPNRVLPSLEVTNSLITPTYCQTACSLAGYIFAGVEYGNQCFCSNALPTTVNAVSDTQCSMACSGDSSQKCGGSYRIGVYGPPGTPFGTTATSSSSSSSSTTITSSATSTSTKTTTTSASTSSSAPTITPTPATVPQTVSLGCYTDFDAPNRILSSALYSDPVGMTATRCQSLCSNYSFFGLEYGYQCLCGNSVNGATLGKTSSGCDTPCPGDATGTTTCGGMWKLQMYLRVASGVSVPNGAAIGSSQEQAGSDGQSSSSTSS